MNERFLPGYDPLHHRRKMVPSPFKVFRRPRIVSGRGDVAHGRKARPSNTDHGETIVVVAASLRHHGVILAVLPVSLDDLQLQDRPVVVCVCCSAARVSTAPRESLASRRRLVFRSATAAPQITRGPSSASPVLDRVPQDERLVS